MIIKLYHILNIILATSTSQIIQNSNFNNNNNNPASSTINNKIEPPIDGLKQNLANEKKSAGNYIIAFMLVYHN